jgi:hypothetical protein
MTTVTYEDNGLARMKHITGPPELLVSYPEKPCTLEELLEHVVVALNENLLEVEELVQNYCDYGSADVDCVELNNDGEFEIHVYDDAGSIRFRFSVFLSMLFTSEEIRLCVTHVVDREREEELR